MSPVRIQRKRTKGWRMPEGAIYVGRPSKWGNTYAPENFTIITNKTWDSRPATIAECVAAFREDLLEDDVTTGLPSLAEVRSELAGHDLACWCPLDQPCHADVLLEVANR